MAKNTNKQGKVGYGCPPVEHQFKPGEVANPKGPPKASVQLWRYFCLYANMTDAKLDTLKKKSLTQSQQAAVRLVKNFKDGKFSGSGKLARYIIDREEGKALETVKITGAEPLSDAECEGVRNILRKNGTPD